MVVLPAPFGPSSAEHLAAPHGDVDPAHRLEVAVALAQRVHLDRRGVVAHRAIISKSGACCPGNGRDCYQCTPRVSVAIAICSNEARSSMSCWPFAAAESGNTR